MANEFLGIKVQTVIESNSEIQKKIESVLKTVNAKISINEINISPVAIENVKKLLGVIKDSTKGINLNELTETLKQIEKIKIKPMVVNVTSNADLSQLNNKLTSEEKIVADFATKTGIKYSENLTKAIKEGLASGNLGKLFNGLENGAVNSENGRGTKEYIKRIKADYAELESYFRDNNNKMKSFNINSSDFDSTKIKELQQSMKGLATIKVDNPSLQHFDQVITELVAKFPHLMPPNSNGSYQDILTSLGEMNSKYQNIIKSKVSINTLSMEDEDLIRNRTMKDIDAMISKLMQLEAVKKDIANVNMNGNATTTNNVGSVNSSAIVNRGEILNSHAITTVNGADVQSVTKVTEALGIEITRVQDLRTEDGKLAETRTVNSAKQIAEIDKFNEKILTFENRIKNIAKGGLLDESAISRLKQQLASLTIDSSKTDTRMMNENLIRAKAQAKEIADINKSADQKNVVSASTQAKALYMDAEASLSRQFALKNNLIKAGEQATAEAKKQLVEEDKILADLKAQLSPAYSKKLNTYEGTLQNRLDFSTSSGMDKLNNQVKEVEGSIVKLKNSSKDMIPVEQLNILESALQKLKTDLTNIGNASVHINIGDIKSQISSIETQFRELNNVTKGNAMFDEMTKKAKNFTVDMNTQIDNLKHKYGSHIPTAGLDALKLKLQELNNIPVGARTEQDLAKMNQAMKELRQSYAQLDSETRANAGGFFGTLSHNIQSFMGFYVGAGGIISVINGIKSGVASIVEMDTALTSLSKVTDLSKTKLDEMKDSAIEMGKALGNSGSEVMKGMAEFGRMYKDTELIKSMTEVAIVGSNVTTLSVQESSKALSTAIISFGLDAKDSMKILDSWNEIQNRYRISAEDMASSIGKVGAISRETNLSIDELNGATTTLVQGMGISGDEAGTA